jgi:hypothetical protein
MDDRIKRRLGIETSQKATNVDGYLNLNVTNSEAMLPVGDMNRIVDAYERFNKERQESPFYRLVGTIRPLMSNVLFNISGVDSWSSFDDNIFRDQSYPPNSSPNDGEDITYAESVSKHLSEVDGWFGYYDPDIFGTNLCTFTDMEPKRRRFSFKKDKFNNDIKNWEVTVTYPSSSADTQLTMGGLMVFDKVSVSVATRDMTALGIPVLHNIQTGEMVRITGTNFDGDYVVQRVGMDNGDLMGYYFVIDVDPTTSVIGPNSRFKKVVGGEESVYYFRIFEKVKTRVEPVIEDDDYEIYPLNFANNIYNDGVCQLVFNEDIDVSNLTDNLGRPLSELFLTIVKTEGNDVEGSFNGFTDIKSGIEIPYMPEIQATNAEPYKVDIPDIRRIHDGGLTPTMSHTPLETNILISTNGLFGDVVEYNRHKVKETVLADVHHRFNTANRLGNGNVASGPREEGYYYKAHYPITIRNFSPYIEQGDINTVGIPDYAEDLGDGRWLWRDFLDIGFNIGQDNPVNYPFLNGAHYIHQNYCITLKRQDSFGRFGLYYSAPINSDPAGDTMDDNFTTNHSEDVC